MRDIVPKSVPSLGNKENQCLGRSASSASKTSVHFALDEKSTPTVTKVRTEMKSISTPQSSRDENCQFVTPKTPASVVKPRVIAASSLAARRTPVNSTRSGQQVTTPASDHTQGFVRRMATSSATTPFRSTTSSLHGKSGATPVKISRVAVTPCSVTSAQVTRPGLTPVSRKVDAATDTMPKNVPTVQPAGTAVQAKPGVTPVSCKAGAATYTVPKNTTIAIPDEESHVMVAVRVRPLSHREKNESCSVVEAGAESCITVTQEDSSSLSFQYDHCFGPTATQSDVFRSLVHPLLSKALEGYNACLFSYGQTGSGKTYSMMGGESLEEGNLTKMGRETGIIPRFGFSLFERLARKHDVSVDVSYFEIYNEKIRDLLSEETSRPMKTTLKVREHPQLGPYVEGLVVHSVATFESLQGWLRLGLSRRATAASAMNDKSSRSHCIFSVCLTQGGGGRRSKVHLVDLAGSERLASTSATGDRLKEGVSINTSLLTLGKVISALADKQRRTFVPYRDSLLTWLLSDSLGGNARTVMLATVSPARMYVEETLATLRYACQARAIINRPQLQHGTPAAAPLAHRQIQDELDRLRLAREEYERRGVGNDLEVAALQAELTTIRQKLRDAEEHKKEWEARVKASEIDRSRQTEQLVKRGVAECSAPSLRLLTSDPLLSLCFALPDSTCTRKVLGGCQPPADIALQGLLIEDQHCLLEWRAGTLWLVPGESPAESYVNGELVQEEVPLAHGDRLALSGELFLLVQLEPSLPAAVDYQWACMELNLAQNARLNMELAEAKERAILDLEAMVKQMENLGASKNATEKEMELIKCEGERKMAKLQAEVDTQRRRLEMAFTSMDSSFTPFASNFLQELKELEADFIGAGAGQNLHEMRCLVREASQRCRRLNVPYVFGQVQQAQAEPLAGESALQPRVLVRGEGHQSAICSPETFITLLLALRECEDEGHEKNMFIGLMSELLWEEDSVSSGTNIETSVTVDTGPFRRRLLSLSVTTHEDSISSHSDVEKYLLSLHNTLSKLQAATLKQPSVQAHIHDVKNAICKLERACLHPELDSYQNSEVSVVSQISGTYNHHTNLESYELPETLHRISEVSLTVSYGDTSCGPDKLPARPDSEAARLSNCSNTSCGSKMVKHLEVYSTVDHSADNNCSTTSRGSKVKEEAYSSVDVDLVLQQLKDAAPSEPSLSSTMSTVLHSPPSISAQPTKSNMRNLTVPSSPCKEVRFKQSSRLKPCD